MVVFLYKKKKILAIIPARKGSTGIKEKNIRLVKNKPLIGWTLELADSINFFDKVVVSSDCEKIKNITVKHKIDFIDRPKIISSSTAKTDAVLIHTIDYLERKELYFDYIVTLEPTSPLRKKETVVKSIKKAVNKKLDSLICIKQNQELIGKLINDKFIPLVNQKSRRRQERKSYFCETGVSYITNVNFLKKKKKMISKRTGFLIVDSKESLDINDEVDLKLANLLIT